MYFTIFLVTTLLINLQQFVEACYGGMILRTEVPGSRLTPLEKKSILDLHNFFRDQVAGGQIFGQPPAQNMNELVWDEKLSEFAQRWTDRCMPVHSPAEIRVSDGIEMGENMGMLTFSPPTIYILSLPTCSPDVTVKSWFDEVKSYQITNGINHAVGHYTQMVWANTKKIGCGFTVFLKGNAQHCFLSCNYGPAGNYISETPYMPGPKNCQAHRLMDSPNYRNLCRALW